MLAQRILVLLALSTVACGSNDERIEPETSSLVFEGEATPEAFEVMISTEPMKWEWAAGVPETPADGAVLSAASAAAFTWSSDLLHDAEVPTGGPPLSGVAFWLKFSSSEGKLLDVFTTKNDYTPDADAWERLGTAPGSVTLLIDSCVFEANALVPEKVHSPVFRRHFP